MFSCTACTFNCFQFLGLLILLKAQDESKISEQRYQHSLEQTAPQKESDVS